MKMKFTPNDAHLMEIIDYERRTTGSVNPETLKFRFGTRLVNLLTGMQISPSHLILDLCILQESDVLVLCRERPVRDTAENLVCRLDLFPLASARVLIEGIHMGMTDKEALEFAKKELKTEQNMSKQAIMNLGKMLDV
ncbi:hypothetical protein ISN45_Aa03g039020 [Arabidopsis thaliana x Arabidopsis arenosa]|uniref:Uncharacterized protein n=1 Tax=Arabidopsis thaliana x Arabidopsis arenosa TaxID=1240361 RepID=A0A8T2B096_9BRAS|nr:hypothetical protein ISN45_Aa03g039020 [Arabidopsis thaliana x Arabidopsis arenosa]